MTVFRLPSSRKKHDKRRVAPSWSDGGGVHTVAGESSFEADICQDQRDSESSPPLHLSIVAKKHSIATTTQLRSLELLKKLLSCICYMIWIDWHMIFGLEQEGGSLITPTALAHPLHPIDNRSRNKRRNLWVGRCVSSRWLWFPSRSSVLYIYIYRYMYVHCSKYLKERMCFFIPHSRGLIQSFLLKFWVKQWCGRMLYTTASKHLQKLWNWPYVHSVEKSSLFP